jgi:acyl carrier protein
MFVEYLISLLGRVYKVPGTIDPTVSFQQLEVDSLSLAELGAQLEEDFGVEIDDEQLTGETTVAELAGQLEADGAVLPA